jgi:hypothetical protein
MSTTAPLTSQLLAQRNCISGNLQFDPIRDLRAHYNEDGDSFYMLSYVSGDNHDFTVLFHQMLIYRSPLGPIAQLAISIFDEGTKDYHFGEITYFLPFLADRNSIAVSTGNTISQTILDIAMPTGRLHGTMDEMYVEAYGDAVLGLNMRMEAHGPILSNLVTGVIPFGGGVNIEYAFPRMDTSGTLTVLNKTYDVKGTSWFDRQWGRFGPYKWTWMNIQLDNGVQMSLWDQQGMNLNPGSFLSTPNKPVPGERAFVTILNPDNSIAVADVNVIGSDLWTSPGTGIVYPTRWKVAIPSMRAALDINLLAQNQEIDSPIKTSRMEGKAAVRGTYDKGEVKGCTIVEMFNLFPLFSQAYAGPLKIPANGQTSVVR